ncbi:MAG: hypothetical protein HUK04_05525 [Bacteroidaceae bacterium]|nr:hypothetical protein [Bacteroidaceae bacterium]
MSLIVIPIVSVVVFVAGLVKTAFDVKNGREKPYKYHKYKKKVSFMDPLREREKPKIW